MEKESKEFKIRKYFESVQPEIVLSNWNQGMELSKRDLKTIEEVRKTGLPTGVINVLFDYILHINKGNLPRHYVERMAKEWAKLKIDTVDKAMETAKKDFHQPPKTFDKNNKVEENKVLTARLDAIENAAYNPNMTDQQLGKFVRKLFSYR